MCLNLVLLLGALQLTYSTNSPWLIVENGKENYLECYFQGWPNPSVAWYKDDKRIINGYKGFYYTERVFVNDQRPSEYILHFPAGGERYEGFYTCVAKNSILGWSSTKQSPTIEVTYNCK